MNFLDVPLKIKSLADDGQFSGYASVWDIQDRQKEIVRRGAFKEIERNDDGKVVVLWQHKSGEPIAAASVQEDDYGLHFDGQLILDDPLARIAQAHMKAKTVRGMSIGFETLASNPLADGVRELTAIKLWELSLVTFPALPEAQVQTVKSFADCASERELKNFLRERDGLSRNKANAAAEALWRILRGADAETPEEANMKAEQGAAACRALQLFNRTLKGN